MQGPFTILAPSNAAFNENPDLLRALFNPRNVEVCTELMKDRPSNNTLLKAVQDLLLYHVVQGLSPSTDLIEGSLPTLENGNVDVRLDPIRFNQAGVSQADLVGCNSIIHIIDDTLIPLG